LTARTTSLSLSSAHSQEILKLHKKFAARDPLIVSRELATRACKTGREVCSNRSHPKQPKGNKMKKRKRSYQQNYDYYTREKQKKLADNKRGNQELSNKYKIIVAKNYVSISAKLTPVTIHH
jgi:hypothetical protein